MTGVQTCALPISETRSVIDFFWQHVNPPLDTSISSQWYCEVPAYKNVQGNIEMIYMYIYLSKIQPSWRDIFKPENRPASFDISLTAMGMEFYWSRWIGTPGEVGEKERILQGIENFSKDLYKDKDGWRKEWIKRAPLR